MEGYPGISHYKNLTLAYPKTTLLFRLIPGYPGISHKPGNSTLKEIKNRFLSFEMA